MDGIETIFGLIPGEQCAVPVQAMNETAFADHGAQPIIASAAEIVPKTCTAMGIIDSEFSRFGLILNYTRGKTEALIVFKGREAYKYRVMLLVEPKVL